VSSCKKNGLMILDGMMSNHALELFQHFQKNKIPKAGSVIYRFIFFVYFLAEHHIIKASFALRAWKHIVEHLDDKDKEEVLAALSICMKNEKLEIDKHYYLAAEFCEPIGESVWLVKQLKKYSVGNTRSLENKLSLCSAMRLHIDRGFMFNMPKASKEMISTHVELFSEIERDTCRLFNAIGSGNLAHSQSIENILFVIGHIQPLPNIGSHMRQIVSYVTGFAKKFPKKKVRLVVTNEMTTQGFEFNLHALPPTWIKIINRQFKEVIDEKIPKNLELMLLSPHETDSFFNTVAESSLSFQPDITFSWLGFYASELFRKAISEHCPVVSIQFNAGNPPDSDSELILSQGYRDSFVGLERSDDWRHHSIPLVPPKRWTKLDCSTVVDPERFKVVTTLGGGRLEKSFSMYAQETLDRFIRIFEKNVDVDWLLVGIKDTKNLVNADSRIDSLIKQGRLKIIDYFEDLRALYSCCDLYVHLPSTGGGGWGVGMAVFESLPVLAESGTDSNNFLPPESIYRNDHELFDKLEVLIRNREERRVLARIQLSRMDERHRPDNVAKDLFEIAIEAREKWLSKI
jgi:glycosyltransferase involved in cell wall biosynthesis